MAREPGPYLSGVSRFAAREGGENREAGEDYHSRQDRGGRERRRLDPNPTFREGGVV